MNAIEFVKKKGINYAVKFLNYDPSICGDTCDLDFDETDNLKQIVEAFELIEKHGGIHGFKTYCNGDFSDDDLKSINLVEQCQ